MCGRYILISDFEMLALRYNFSSTDSYAIKSGEIFPSDVMPVITQSNEKNTAVQMKWDFSPFGKGHIINARSETVTVKTSFKNSFLSRRCIIPANGFYEWQKNGRLKIKYRIALKNEPIFSLAGIYDIFRDESGKMYNGFVILTTKPNKLMSEIHDRMPVILSKENESLWLSNSTPLNKLTELMQPYDEKQLKVNAE